ncbi:winged helix-turn-helix domain-containing protein [Streptomyces sp. NPDC023723]|uniref:winged helix-turn-helix domain-containing protein n=1 Tax=Streptomyces sp. NPDC023723 TaxID=3154323 RepID=UPI0033C62F3E
MPDRLLDQFHGPGLKHCGADPPPAGHPSWTTPRLKWCWPPWSRAPRRTGSRRTCGNLERVGVVVERVTRVTPARASVWRLLTGRLGWSMQRPRRPAVERDESETARRVAHEWPRTSKGGSEETCLDRALRRIGRVACLRCAAPTRPAGVLPRCGTG